MKVKYIYLDRQYAGIRDEMIAAIDDIMSRGAFILRPELEILEKKLAARLGVAHVVGVNSGTDALYLGVRALNLPAGSEVITVAHTFIATIGAVIHAGLRPVLVDVGGDFNIDPAAVAAAVTSQTKAILVVHMNGRACRMDRIMDIAEQHGLAVIEDAAQAIGARFQGRCAGTFGRWGAFSLHPMKILGVAGDGGFLATDDDKLADDFRMMRNIGQRRKGVFETYAFNSRLDTLQAAICLVKLRHFDSWLDRRRRLAARYDAELAGLPGLTLPPRNGGEHDDVYASYVIRSDRRDDLQLSLAEAGVETMVHWSPPLHRQPQLAMERVDLPVTEALSQEVLSLPIDPEMTDEEHRHVIDAVATFQRRGR